MTAATKAQHKLAGMQMVPSVFFVTIFDRSLPY